MKYGMKFPSSRIIRNNCTVEALSIEEEMLKAKEGKEPLKATAKVTYNDRRDGVLPQHDIRTDRFDVALQQTTKVHKSEAAKRQAQDFPMPKDENGNPLPQGEA